MSVLYGVFLYMGVASLKGVQLIERIEIMFEPTKYQPDLDYLRHVPLRRVHLFTVIQLICLVVMWVLKTMKYISLSFPVLVLALCFVRKGMDFLFTQYELSWIDDLLPDIDSVRDGEKQLFSSNPKNLEVGEDEHGGSGSPSQQISSQSSVSGSLCPEAGPLLKGTLRAGHAALKESDEIFSLNMSQSVTTTSIWKRLLNASRNLDPEIRNSDDESQYANEAHYMIYFIYS